MAGAQAIRPRCRLRFLLMRSPSLLLLVVVTLAGALNTAVTPRAAVATPRRSSQRWRLCESEEPQSSAESPPSAVGPTAAKKDIPGDYFSRSFGSASVGPSSGSASQTPMETFSKTAPFLFAFVFIGLLAQIGIL